MSGGADLSSAQCHRAANYGATVRAGPRSGQPRGFEARLGVRRARPPRRRVGLADDHPAAGPRGRLAEPDRRGPRNRLFQPLPSAAPTRPSTSSATAPTPNSPYAPIRSVVTSMNHENRCPGSGAQLSERHLRLVPQRGNDRDGQVGGGLKGQEVPVEQAEAEEEVQEGGGQGQGEGSQGQEEVQVQEEQEEEEVRVQEDSEQAPLRVRRLGWSARPGQVLVALRRRLKRPPSWTRTAAFPSATVPSATTSPAGTRFTSIASTAHRRRS